MRKKAFPIIIVFAGLIALLYLLSAILTPKKNLEAYGIEEERANAILGEKEDTIDLLVIGNSLAYTDFIPPQLWKDTGYTSYTCGTNDQFLDYSLEMLRRTLKKQKPSIVFLETESFYREISTFTALLADASHIMPCFRYHDRWKSLGLYDFIPPFTVENSYQSKYMGYVFHEKVAPSPAEDIEKHMQYTSDAEPVVQWNRIFINRIADLCSKNDIKLVLISMPNTKAWDMKRHNGVDNIARELGCEYIDLNLINEEIGIDWKTDTSDNGEHMNYPGAMKVTRYLTGYLKQTGMLTDHRSDPHYSDWDDHLRTYEKYLKKRERSAGTQDGAEKT